MKTVEIWIAMDSDGDIALSHDDGETAITNYLDNYSTSLPLRVAKLTVHMEPPPEETDAGEVTVPDEAGQTVTAEAAR